MGKKRVSLLVFLAVFFTYSIISMTKSAYASSMASIIGDGILKKSSAGLVNASFFLFYGGFQIFGVRFVDKISPVKLVSMTLLGTLIATTGMAFSNGFLMMLIFWSFCGLVQFSIWPATLRIISEYILIEHRETAKVYISFSFCIGTLLNYLVTSIVLGVSRWQMLFLVLSGIVLLCLTLWLFLTSKYKKTLCEIAEENKAHNAAFLEHDKKLQKSFSGSFLKLIAMSGILLLLIPGFIRAALDLGVKAWVPTMIIENYGVSESFASMLTTVLLFVNLSGIFIAGFFYPKKIKSAVLCYSLCFITILPFTCLLLLTGKIPLFFVVLFLIVITTLMYSGHQLINVIIPSQFAVFNKAGSVASIINAISSFGAVFSNIVFGMLAENYGWGAVTLSWVVLAVISSILCLLAVPLWKKFMLNQ